MGARPVLSLRRNTSFKHPWEKKTALETLRAPGFSPPHPIPVKPTPSNCSSPSGVMWQSRKQWRLHPRSIRTNTYLWIYQCPSQAIPLGMSIVSESSTHQDVGSLPVLPERGAFAELSTVQSGLSSEGSLSAAVCQTEQENTHTP